MQRRKIRLVSGAIVDRDGSAQLFRNVLSGLPIKTAAEAKAFVEHSVRLQGRRAGTGFADDERLALDNLLARDADMQRRR